MGFMGFYIKFKMHYSYFQVSFGINTCYKDGVEYCESKWELSAAAILRIQIETKLHNGLSSDPNTYGTEVYS